MARMTQYLSLAEAADRLGVSPRTVRRMIADGTIAGYRIRTRMLRVTAADVEGLLSRRIPTAKRRAA